jgi:hypothetical protein
MMPRVGKEPVFFPDCLLVLDLLIGKTGLVSEKDIRLRKYWGWFIIPRSSFK